MTNVAEMLKYGWALVPIPLGQKRPVNTGWNLKEKCIKGVEREHILEGMNIGLAHAYCTPRPTCAIDIDNYKAAKLWLATHGIDLNGLLEAEDAVVIWSGKKYSLKLLYTLPAGIPPMISKQINSPDGKVALEFRCATLDGKTVQDVLPPSIHPSGKAYQWLGHGNPLKLPEIPEAIYRLWNKLIENKTRVSERKFLPHVSAQKRPESVRQIAIIKEALSHTSSNCSYEVWRNIVWAILSTGWVCAERIAKDWSQQAPDRYVEDSFWAVVNSYMPDRERPITLGTLYHHARLGGWRG